MGFLTLPIALAGLLALPVLAAVYLLQSRYRRRVVSSHVIWQQLSSVRTGGQRVEQFRPPWLLLLAELLIISALVVAAAGPRVTAQTVAVPVAVVLDDSYTMQATPGGGSQSLADQAAEAVSGAVTPGRQRVRLIAAADEPRLLSDVIERGADLGRALEAYEPTAWRADLDAGIGRASELVGDAGRVLVVTHRPPDDPAMLEANRVRWISVGEPAANVAIVGAWRSEGPSAEGDAGSQRLTLEVTNFAEQATEAVLRIEQEEQPVQRIGVPLQAGQTRRVPVTIAAAAPAHAGVEGDDALTIDDRVVLLDPSRRAVRVALAVADDAASDALRGALAATGGVRFVDADAAELLITDAAPASDDAVRATASRHVLHLLDTAGENTSDTRLLTGPFARDTSHPLMEGVSLAGVLWAIGPDAAEEADDGGGASVGDAMTGRPLVMAGNAVLLSVAERASGGRDVYLRWRAAGSNLTQSPDWVILLDNLVRWRLENRPGVSRVNAAVGDAVTFRLPRGVSDLTLHEPGGGARTIRAPGGSATVTLDGVGVWRYEAGDAAAEDAYRGIAGGIAVNTANAEASDLRASESGEWGEWAERDVAGLGRTYHEIAWLIVLVAVGLLLLHGWLLRHGGAAGGGSVAQVPRRGAVGFGGGGR